MTATIPGTENPAAGRLYGVGVGPGDPDLVTVAAARRIALAQVVAWNETGTARRAKRAAAPYLVKGQVLLPCPIPMRGSEKARAEALRRAALTLSSHLKAGRDVAFLCLGDPLLYGSYWPLHRLLAQRYESVILPGVPAFLAAAAAWRQALTKGDDSLTVTTARDCLSLRRRLGDGGAAVVLKPEAEGGFSAAGRMIEALGLGASCLYAENVATPGQRLAPFGSAALSDAPYFSMLLVAGRNARAKSS